MSIMSEIFSDSVSRSLVAQLFMLLVLVIFFSTTNGITVSAMNKLAAEINADTSMVASNLIICLLPTNSPMPRPIIIPATKDDAYFINLFCRISDFTPKSIYLDGVLVRFYTNGLLYGVGLVACS